MKQWFLKITYKFAMWDLRRSVEYWEKIVPELESRLDFARTVLSHYREEFERYDQEKTK